MPALRTIRVTRYVAPLREGGSLPAIVEADDDGLYVLKFRGAGQGPRALIAEVISGAIAKALGLPVPDLVIAELDRDLARTEPDPEIHALIYDSAGLNLAVDFLPGAVSYTPPAHVLDPDFARRVVWFDAFVTNVDRTVRNTNMLMWHRQPWLIDHGATLYFHHTPGWDADVSRAARDPFPLIRKHVLWAGAASRVADIDAEMSGALSTGLFAGILDMVPDTWLAGDEPGADTGAVRAGYVRYLASRLEAPRPFLDAIRHAD